MPSYSSLLMCLLAVFHVFDIFVLVHGGIDVNLMVVGGERMRKCVCEW